MFIVRNRKFFYFLSGLLVALSIVSLSVWGLKFGIDFKGGSLLEVSYPQGRPEVDSIKNNLDRLGLQGISVRPTEQDGVIVRTPYLSEQMRLALVNTLSNNGQTIVNQKRFDSVGPVIGSELRTKALTSIALVILAIVLFITFAFRKVSDPVSSWKYGSIAIVALVHDVIIPTGAFSVLGHFYGMEVDTLFVTAILVVLGFSVHDTIVVFDRVRENLRLNRESRKKEIFEETVGRSLSQTFARSINTSLTTVLALVALYFVGSDTTRHFALALLIGIVAGTYSSVFIGTPLLVTVEKNQK